MNDLDRQDPSHHHRGAFNTTSAEVLRGAHGTGRSVGLIPFVAVMAALEVLNVILTLRLHEFSEDGTLTQRLADDVSRFGNALFLLFLIASVIAVIASRDKTPRFVLPMLTTYLSVASLNVLINIVTMFIQPLSAHQSQVNPLIDLILVFSSVTLIFSLWYELIDVTSPFQAIDFPHRGGEGELPIRWFDYLVIAFYSNSTFGPTTETIRSRRIQFLMMVQVSLALMVLVVLVARIVKAS